MPLSRRHRIEAAMQAAAVWPQPAAAVPATPAAGGGVCSTRVLAVLAYLQGHQDMGAAGRSLARQPVIREAAAMLLGGRP